MKRIFFNLLFIAVAAGAFAQSPYFQEYTLLNRKENVHVNKMLQDRDGFMWFGTTKGLFRFDGRRYLRFTEADSLQGNNVTAIASDSEGRIWAGHSNGKISILDNGIITAFEPEEGNSAGQISDILFDSRGIFWFSTLNDGIYYLRSNRLYRLDEHEGLPDLYVYDLAEDDEGNILAGTDGGVAIISMKKPKPDITVFNYKTGLPDNIIRKITVDAKSYYFGTEDAGVVRFDRTTRKFSKLTDGWDNGPVTDIISKGDQLWIACPQKGLGLYEETNAPIRFFSIKESSSSSVETLLLDTEKNIWAGTKSSLVRTSGNAISFIDTRATPDENVLAVTADKTGRIWFSNGHGLFVSETTAAGENRITKQISKEVNGVTIISLYTDEGGVIWAGLYGEGVLRIDPATLKIRHFNKELRNGNVLNITGKGNNIWLATLGGVTKISTAGEELTFTSLSKTEGLASDFIYQVYVDSKDRVWLSTDGKGVDMIDSTGIHHFTKGLPVKIVYGVAEDSEGKIWANVQGSGLYYFNGTDEFVQDEAIQTRKMELHALSTDKQGNLIAVHDDGIDVLDPDKRKTRYVGEEAGLREKVANLNSISADDNGDLLVGTSSGIIKITEGTQFLEARPLARIPLAKVYDKPRQISSIGDLSYNEDNVTFHIAGLWYQNPESLGFQYKLENYDNDWIATRDNSVIYSRLPPGDYIFRVRVSETESFAGADETFVAFVVHPPFWRTTWFYILSAVALAISAYTFLKYSERKLRYSNMILEARVKARTHEIQRQNDEIQAQNEEITAQAEEIKGINENLEMLVGERTAELERKNKALAEYAFINAHKLRSPVASILGLAHLMTKTSLDDEGREITKRLQQSADELDDIVRSITKAIERGERPKEFYGEKEDQDLSTDGLED
jgi:ligand-binding sensor domain-containing protein